jgi:integrase
MMMVQLRMIGRSCFKMPRPRPLHLHLEVTRHGARVWYVRLGKGPRTRIKGEYGSPEFQAAYQTAIAGESVAPKPAVGTSSLAWLIARYRDSSAWAKFSPATRRQRENIFLQIIASAGAEPYARITRGTINAAISRRKETPFQAQNFLKTMRGLFSWAVDAELVSFDPTERIKAQTPRSEGFKVWTEEEIDRFEARWPIGTRERLALAILLYTGLRRGDAVRLGRQHIRDDVISMRTEKTGTPVNIPLLPELAEIIAASKTGDLAFIATAAGAPMAKEGFGNWFREACDAAGVKGSAHGLRKAGATRAANNGATVAQLEAIFGWTGGNMAAHYTRQADRTRLAREGMTKLSKVKT